MSSLSLSQKELKNHYYLSTRKNAASFQLKGDMVGILLLIDDPISNWNNPADIEEFKNAYYEGMYRLKKEAALYKVDWQSRHIVLRYSISQVATHNNHWEKEVYQQMGKQTAIELQRYYTQTYSCNTTPIIFAFNRAGRSYGQCEHRPGVGDKRSVIFRSHEGRFTARSILHELLHQYGALDYYYPDTTAGAAKEYFPDSIMFRYNAETIDDLTKYLIGWTDQITVDTYAFLAATKSVTEQQVHKEITKQYR